MHTFRITAFVFDKNLIFKRMFPKALQKFARIENDKSMTIVIIPINHENECYVWYDAKHENDAQLSPLTRDARRRHV